MKKFALLFLAMLWLTPSFAQYSSMDFGMMRVHYKRSGPFKDSWWPGLSVNAAGFTFTRYAGETQLRDTVAGLPKDWNPHGLYYSIGYTSTRTNIFNKDLGEDMKRPFIVPYGGIGIGGMMTHQQWALVNLNISSGVAINLLPGVAVSAGFHTGINFKRLGGSFEEPLVEGAGAAIPRFFWNMNLGFRIYYSLGKSVSGTSSTKERFHPAGWYSYQYESGGWIYSGQTYSEGGTWSNYAIVTTSEHISLAPVVYFPKGFDGVGLTRAFGGKMAIRTGLLNGDLQYMKGRVGFLLNGGSFAGSLTNQCYWNMSQASFSVGINAFNIFMPFKGPSVYRFIIGNRFGMTNMEAVYTGGSTYILPPAPKEKMFARNFFLAAELGRFGLSWDFYNSKAQPDYNSKGVLSAYYMIPIL